MRGIAVAPRAGAAMAVRCGQPKLLTSRPLSPSVATPLENMSWETDMYAKIKDGVLLYVFMRCFILVCAGSIWICAQKA